MIDNNLLKEALNQILCCPICKGDLSIDTPEKLRCDHCARDYPMKDGIFVFLSPEILRQQSDEQRLREEAAKDHGNSDLSKILEVVSQHHCLPVMSKKAGDFRLKLDSAEWIVDIGCGSGYYWLNSKAGGRLVLIDFACGNLKAAQHLLGGQKEIIFIQADAAHLPLKPHSISGVWSVQVTQHFVDSVFDVFLSELKRILKKRYLIEVYNLNPALFHRILYRIIGKKMHIKGEWNGIWLNLYNRNELLRKWQNLSSSAKLNFGYSELFFHPYLRLRFQNRYVVLMESFFAKMPQLAHLFARQIDIKFSSGF